MKRTALYILVASLAFPAYLYGQGKPVVAIGQVQTAAQNISCEGWDRSVHDCNADLSEGFRIMLETAITKTGKMGVMERRQVDAILGEQVLGEAGLTSAGGSIGGLTGVDYMIYGTVTRFGSQQQSLSVSSNRGVGSVLGSRTRQALGGGLSSGKTRVEMGVDLKVTDVSTGQIIVADEVSGTVEHGSAFSVGGVASADESADPFADVQRVVASRIAEVVVTSRIPYKVIAVQSDGTLILNYGDVFLAPGDVLAAFSVGETFVDPDTGEVLGSEQTEIGSVQVTAAEPRLSRAAVLQGNPAVFTPGTQLKRSQTAQSDGGSTERKRSGPTW